MYSSEENGQSHARAANTLSFYLFTNAWNTRARGGMSRDEIIEVIKIRIRHAKRCLNDEQGYLSARVHYIIDTSEFIIRSLSAVIFCI